VRAAGHGTVLRRGLTRISHRTHRWLDRVFRRLAPLPETPEIVFLKCPRHGGNHMCGASVLPRALVGPRARARGNDERGRHVAGELLQWRISILGFAGHYDQAPLNVGRRQRHRADSEFLDQGIILNSRRFSAFHLFEEIVRAYLALALHQPHCPRPGL